MELLFYLLKVTACTALFFGFYLLVLRRLTFFKINRFYLLTTLLLSFIIPALQFDLVRTVAPAKVAIPTIETNVAAPITFEMPPLPVDAETGYSPEYQFEWYNLVSIGYALVAFTMLGFCLWKLSQLVKHSKAHTSVINGLKIIPKPSGFTNCSFFNYVFIDENSLAEKELEVLLAHERVHAEHYHSIDKILLMIFKAMLWFNPIVYLYDKALEQTHEYEADEITSSNVGSQQYAALLLKLAVAKSDMPLIHNFVKSPIKDRIKMLFNSKSRKIKKSIYLLALPVAIGLVWLFAVQVVYAQATGNKSTEIKPVKDFYEGTLKGKVTSIDKAVFGYTFDIVADGKTYAVEATNFKDKIKVGDELIAFINARLNNFKIMDKNGKVIKSSTKAIYYPEKITTLNGKLIYEHKFEKNAFLYEVNKARYTSSKIKSIQKNTDGTLQKIVLNDGTFTINLNLSTLNVKGNNFKVGDQALVKFIGEKLVSKNVYSTDKMIVLTSEPKKHEIKNESLYNRFYQKDGRQKVAGVKPIISSITEPMVPEIISFQKSKGDIKNHIFYFDDATVKIGQDILKAEKLIWNKAKGTISATKVTITNADGNFVDAGTVDIDLNSASYKVYSAGGSASKLKADQNMLQKVRDSLEKQDQFGERKIEYSAKDSVKFSKDKSIISLYGKASLTYGEINLVADKIIYNSIKKTGVAKNVTIKTLKNGVVMDGSDAKFDLNNKGKFEVWQSNK
ncbi:hypothetical protein EZ449_00355 [Pedobacter frigidisoli]|uniref:Peptidase M56 domain-containing protein n=1 Tax=Pedobacter frigidisoli TaxID=2530455 RepID=A0A4R0P949_9SPHI|nr:M56 family metallopeptidase [Pedobacter frigidisoli]TCD12537.1 hypothetical protein EZ449_00355 [Pedobacter frigidisoli]